MSAPDPYSPPEARLESRADRRRASSMSPRARLGRVRFLARVMSLPVVAFVTWTFLISALVGLAGGDGAFSTAIGVGAVVLVGATVAALFLYTMQRLNDLGRHRAWSLLLLVPVVNVFVLVGLGLWPGESATNEFGPPPSPPGAGMIVLGLVMAVLAAFLGLLLWLGSQMPADY